MQEPEESVMSSTLSDERRRSRRLKTVSNQAALVWWERSKKKRLSEGNILDISNQGALVASDSFPELGQSVIIRLKQPVPSDWTRSVVGEFRGHHT